MALKEETNRGPRGPGRLSAEQAADLPDRLLDAALILFSDLGYAATSMEKIARQAGASTKTVYGRYSNKDEILQAVVRRLIERTLAQVDSQTRIAPGQAELREFLINLSCFISGTLSLKEGAGLNRLAMSEAHRSPMLQEFFESSVGRGRRIIQANLDHWKALGALPELEDSWAAAVLYLSMSTDLPRIRSILGIPMTPPEIRAYVVTAVDIFLRGLGYQAPAAAGR